MQTPDGTTPPANDPEIVPAGNAPAGDEVVQVGSSFRDGLAPLHSPNVLLSGHDVSPGAASDEFSAATVAMSAAVTDYERVLREHNLDVADDAVRDAGSLVNLSTVRLAIAHTRLTGDAFPGPADEPTNEDRDGDGAGTVDGVDGDAGDDTAGDWHDPGLPPVDELPVSVAVNTLLADGAWGAITLRGYLVYSTGATLQLDWLLERNGASDEDWDDAWSIFDWFPSEDGGAFPVAVPGEYTVQQVEMGANGGSRVITGQKGIWITPLPADGDIAITVALPRLGLDSLGITVPAAVLRGAAARVISAGDVPPTTTP